MVQRRTKYSVFPIEISRKGEKKSFQLRLPQSACEINGILVTSTAGKSECGKKLEKATSFIEQKQNIRNSYQQRLVLLNQALTSINSEIQTLASNYSQALQAYNYAIGTPDETLRYNELSVALQNYQDKQQEYADRYNEYNEVQQLDQECVEAIDIGNRYQNWIRSTCEQATSPGTTIPPPPPTSLTPVEYDYITSEVTRLLLRSLVGDVKFASADNGDVFFEKQVKVDQAQFEDKRLMVKSGYDSRFKDWIYSQDYSFYYLNEKPQVTILNGFYQDKWKEFETSEDNYKINVYISYSEEG